jgi:hypothetical protein
MVKCGVLFAVRTELLNTIYTSLGFKELTFTASGGVPFRSLIPRRSCTKQYEACNKLYTELVFRTVSVNTPDVRGACTVCALVAGTTGSNSARNIHTHFRYSVVMMCVVDWEGPIPYVREYYLIYTPLPPKKFHFLSFRVVNLFVGYLTTLFSNSDYIT